MKISLSNHISGIFVTARAAGTGFGRQEIAGIDSSSVTCYPFETAAIFNTTRSPGKTVLGIFLSIA